jgi:Fe-S-cluster-containing dehydrogenase component
MMHLDFVDRGTTVQTVPMVCMHCEDPTCAEVCPADAIKQNEDGIVQSSLKPRCIACSNCVFACPFGIPKLMYELDQMMKCDHCYDRTSVGLAPMCASVCPSEALWFGTPEKFRASRAGELTDTFVFGRQVVKTKVRAVVREPGPVAISIGRTQTHWLDDPFGLDEPGDEEARA